MLMTYSYGHSVAKIVGRPLAHYRLEGRWSTGTQVELGDFTLSEMNRWVEAIREEDTRLWFRPAGMS